MGPSIRLPWNIVPGKPVAYSHGLLSMYYVWATLGCSGLLFWAFWLFTWESPEFRNPGHLTWTQDNRILHTRTPKWDTPQFIGTSIYQKMSRSISISISIHLHLYLLSSALSAYHRKLRSSPSPQPQERDDQQHRGRAGPPDHLRGGPLGRP